MNVQGAFDARADVIEKVLDAETFEEVSERGTRSLLTALGRIDVRLERQEQLTVALTRQLALAQRRQAAGR